MTAQTVPFFERDMLPNSNTTDVYAYGFARAIADVSKYARDAARRAMDAEGYLQHAQHLDTLPTPPKDAIEAAIAALDCAREDLERALAFVTRDNG